MNLKNFYNKNYIRKTFVFLFISQISFLLFTMEVNAENFNKANETVEQLLSEAKLHATKTINLDPILRTKKIKSLIEKYINIDFMARATTGPYWKKATYLQKQSYKLALLNQIINTIEVHLNKLSSLTYKTIKTEPRGTKLIYIRGVIEDLDKVKPSVNLLWKIALNKENNYQILDLEIENVSLVSSHKAETTSLLRRNKGNFDILIEKLNKTK
jgi:ABC-type transporter MlaC component